MKKLYRLLVVAITTLLLRLYLLKTWANEWLVIVKKRKMYGDINFNKQQEQCFQNFWVDAYGKKITDRWHKLYQSINGVYNAKYFPDHLFSTQLEPALNNLEYSKFFSDKGITELLYGAVEDVRFPTTVLLKASGIFYDKDRNVVPNDKVGELLQNQGDLVIKPIVGGSSGQGVIVVSVNNDSEKSIVELISEYGDNYIVQEKLAAHSEYSSIYPHSINTVRLITYLVRGEVRNAPLCLRVGVGGKKVDNIHAGGLVVGITDAGFLKKFAYQLGYCDSKVKYANHPDSGFRFEGHKLPGIHEMICTAKQLHGRTPHLGMISWDFMLDINNSVVLVEGNYSGQSIWFPQIAHGQPIFGEDTEYMIKLISRNKD